MLPAHIAQDIRKQILYYLQSTFDFRRSDEDDAFTRFLEDPEQGIFKGPWVSVRRPFRPAPDDFENPFAFPVPFHPFLHQSNSWERLSSRHHPPRSTIVTTGTGSGKTECFLYPVLDHCLRMRRNGQKGIKAIILYPMNALAADQEKRFAEVVWKNGSLRSAGIRVGNYTGRYDPSAPGAAAGSGFREMGPDHGISNHEIQMENPPDVLLTNYKMLDFLLMRPQDQKLWMGTDANVLKYLVLDELHTYDGAQGSDVACLIRRLKARLEIDRGHLCVVGTSATLESREKYELPEKDDGTGDAAELSKERLARFSAKLFEEQIGIGAVVEENRLRVEEVVSSKMSAFSIPAAEDCFPLGDEDAIHYALRQAGLWGAPTLAMTPGDPDFDKGLKKWRVQLGRWIKGTTLFRHLLEVFLSAEMASQDPVLWNDLVTAVSRRDGDLYAVNDPADRESVLGAFLALLSHAREERGGNALILAPTQVQIWVRELRRVGRVLQEKPSFRWLDEPNPEIYMLPAFHCSECGESGWVALHDLDADVELQSAGINGFRLHNDATDIYRAYFGYNGKRSRHIVIISPRKMGEKSPREDQEELPSMVPHLCPQDLMVRMGSHPEDPAAAFPVRINRETRTEENGTVVEQQGCPFCGSVEGVFFIGSQAATLSSVAIDEILGSVLNTDPKLLAFTDSVQDASHRAGFFSARTYHFTLRTSLKQMVDEAGDRGISLEDSGEGLLSWAAAQKPGRPGNVCDAMGALLPPDLHDYRPYRAFRQKFSGEDAPEGLKNETTLRLGWETISEFGLMQTHG